MDLFRMKCFLAAAETGNMTRAAERMNITQPAMSFQIRELERETELSLFNRDRNGIALTPAGEVLRDGFEKILDGYDRLLSKAKACASGRLRITIGYHGPVDWAGVHRFIADFSEQHPEIEIAVLQQQWKELADYLEMGVLDVAFLSSDELTGRKTLDSLPLFRESTCFALSPSHPLARQASVRTEEIRGENIFMNNHPSACMAATIRKLLAAGIPQEDFRFYDEMDITLAMAAARQGLASIPCSFRIENSALSYVDFENEESWMSYSLAWKHDSENRSLPAFCAAAEMAVWPYA